MTLRERIAAIIQGDAHDDAETLSKYSRDTSIFSRTPKVVVFPKNADDVSALVRFVRDAKKEGEQLSLTARSAGTDMTGGPLTDSVLMVFTKYMNTMGPVGEGVASAEPGVYYHDFTKATEDVNGEILPSFPASRDLCAIGGMVANNSGGELTLQYGKTNDYVRSLDVILSDGSHATLRPLSFNELAAKEQELTLEGTVYREIHELIKANHAEIDAAKPTVTKNSAGYALWNVLSENKQTFDLTQLIVGSQGTLGIVTNAEFKLVRTKAHRAMLVMFLKDLTILPEIVRRVLTFKPESFESYDDKTFSLAVRFMPQMLMQMGLYEAIKLGFSFIPDVFTVMRGGVPKLISMAEFAEDTAEEALRKAYDAQASLADLHISSRIAKNESQTKKYWKVRHESFALLRKNVRGLYAAPFIDDIVVHPDDYPQFLPELNKILEGRHFIFTVAGHIGDGNFHVIPLVDMSKQEARQEIFDVMPQVYKLIAKYHGSNTGEHNDGILRTPYLPLMFSPRMIELFAEVKKIFDPQNIFNPGKKVGGTTADIGRDIIKSV